jgi:predicted metal-dependent enzyme (double-stranded beta helix superfamily)
MKLFQELGEQVERLWRDNNYNEDAFSDIAADVLLQSKLSSKTNAWEILEWVFTQQWLPEQRDVDAKFSNAPITLHTGQRFYIDAYYWLDGTTTVHQHGFSGVFQVLYGSSIHSVFSFTPEQKINDHFIIGELKTKKVELLQQGDIQQIRAGDEYIHSLFHLDRPSVTITIRTNQNPTTLPQYDYHKPFIAHNIFYKEQALMKKLQSLSVLLGMQHKDTDNLAKELLRNADLQTTYFVLEYLHNALCRNQLEKDFGVNSGQERFERLVETSKNKHGETIEKFLSVFSERERQMEIVKRRGIITDVEHRFFLALLLNVDERSHLFELIQKKFPDDEPIEKILDWTTELSATKVLGAKESNVLGIENFNDDYIAVLECLLNGVADEEIESAIAENYSDEYAMSLKDSITMICQTLRSSMMFKSLLR